MQNRRKTILINKKFQHHYAIVLVAMTVLATNIIIIGGILLPDEQRLHLSSSMSVVIGLIELFLVAGVWFAEHSINASDCRPGLCLLEAVKSIRGRRPDDAHTPGGITICSRMKQSKSITALHS